MPSLPRFPLWLLLLSIITFPVSLAVPAYQPGEIDLSTRVTLAAALDTSRVRKHGVGVLYLHGVRQLSGTDFAFARSDVFRGELPAGSLGLQQVLNCLAQPANSTDPSAEERPFYVVRLRGSAIVALVQNHLTRSICSAHPEGGAFLQTGGLRYSYYPSRCLIDDAQGCARWVADRPDCQQWRSLDQDTEYLLAVHEDIITDPAEVSIFAPLQSQQLSVTLRAGAAAYFRQFDRQTVNPLSGVVTTALDLTTSTSESASKDLVGPLLLSLGALSALLGNLIFCCTRARQADARARGEQGVAGGVNRSDDSDQSDDMDGLGDPAAAGGYGQSEAPAQGLDSRWPRKRALMVMAGMDT